MGYSSRSMASNGCDFETGHFYTLTGSVGWGMLQLLAMSVYCVNRKSILVFLPFSGHFRQSLVL